MDSFKYQYDENIPHRVTFDIEFIVSRIYDWGQTPSAVSPQSSPTASPSSHTQASSATSLRAAGRSVLTVTGQDIGQVPLQILGGFE